MLLPNPVITKPGHQLALGIGVTFFGTWYFWLKLNGACIMQINICAEYRDMVRKAKAGLSGAIMHYFGGD